MTHFSIYMIWATCTYLVMGAGVLVRRQRMPHVVLMCTAFLSDLILVLLLEFLKGAIETALAFKLGILQQLHIGCSSVALVLYFPVFYLGLKRLLGARDPASYLWHMRLGWAAFIFRTLGFLLMFSLLIKSTTTQ